MGLIREKILIESQNHWNLLENGVPTCNSIIFTDNFQQEFLTVKHFILTWMHYSLWQFPLSTVGWFARLRVVPLLAIIWSPEMIVYFIYAFF